MKLKTMCCTALLASALMLSQALANQGGIGVTPLVAGNPHDTLFSLAFEGDNGIAVGGAGAVYNSVDSGKTWKREAPVTGLSLLGVDSRQSMQLAVGQMGLILRRDALGAWQKVSSGTTERLFAVSLNRRGVAVAVGGFGTILKSDDSGRTWNAIETDWTRYAADGAQPHLYSVKVDEAGVITVAGEFGLILRSVPGQSGWHLLHKGDASIFAIDLRADGGGYAVGQSGLLIASGDNGRTWTAIETGTQANLLGVRSTADGGIVATGMRDMIVSRDAGKSWQHISDGGIGSAWYAGIAQASADAALLAVGSAGKIIRIGN